MSESAFGAVCSTLDAPMTIVTVSGGGERSGCLAGFQTQCSIKPSRWLVCISKTNHTYGVAVRAEYLAVHFLREDQHALAQLFGSISEDDIAPHTKFERCDWQADAHGTPILAGCDYISGRVIERIDAGDHVAHIISIEAAARIHAAARQLGFQEVRDIVPGHTP